MFYCDTKHLDIHGSSDVCYLRCFCLLWLAMEFKSFTVLGNSKYIKQTNQNNFSCFFLLILIKTKANKTAIFVFQISVSLKIAVFMVRDTRQFSKSIFFSEVRSDLDFNLDCLILWLCIWPFAKENVLTRIYNVRRSSRRFKAISFFNNCISWFTSDFGHIFMDNRIFHQGGHNAFAINFSCWNTSYCFEMTFSNFKYIMSH